MGLGKTIQVISLLAALLEKEGNGLDEEELRQRRRTSDMYCAAFDKEAEKAFFAGELWTRSLFEEVGKKVLPKMGPILVMAPSSVVKNWQDDLERWGHFGVAMYEAGNGRNKREQALEQIMRGTAEVLLCPHVRMQHHILLHPPTVFGAYTYRVALHVCS